MKTNSQFKTCFLLFCLLFVLARADNSLEIIDDSKELCKGDDLYSDDLGVCIELKDEQVNRGYCPAGTKETSVTSWPDVDHVTNPDGDEFSVPGDEDTMARCVVCKRGTFSKADEKSCTPCKLGTFNKLRNQKECEDCPQGHITSREGALSCTACSNGKTPNSDKSDCTNCPAGTFSNKDTKFDCEKCPAGHYSGEGASECSLCSGNSVTDGKSCTQCGTNEVPNSARDKCIPKSYKDCRFKLVPSATSNVKERIFDVELGDDRVVKVTGYKTLTFVKAESNAGCLKSGSSTSSKCTVRYFYQSTTVKPSAQLSVGGSIGVTPSTTSSTQYAEVTCPQ